jgi:drug/metabolite transporter (DMT)-like permease
VRFPAPFSKIQRERRPQMKKLFSLIVVLVGGVAGVWFGYQTYGAWTSAIAGIFAGMIALFLYACLLTLFLKTK